jgi:hypothetical protein
MQIQLSLSTGTCGQREVILLTGALRGASSCSGSVLLIQGGAILSGQAVIEEEVEVFDRDDGTPRTEKVRIISEEVLRKKLDDPLYDPVRDVQAASSEGALGDYERQMSVSSRSGQN